MIRLTPDFRTIAYLQGGTSTQRAAYDILTMLGVMETLAAYDARLAGTIPLDVDIPGSDLDIICQVAGAQRDAFAELLRKEYGHLAGFALARKQRYGQTIILCDFTCRDVPIQVYGSPEPVARQRAWVHMIAEAHLLAQAKPEDKEAVRALKLAGVKTEPAFAQVFGLAGDAYETLYELGVAASR